MTNPFAAGIGDARLQRKVLGILNKTDGLAGISNQVLLRMVQQSTMRQLPPKARLWTAGETAQSAWVIVDGAVAVVGAAAEADVASGTAIGVAAVLNAAPWTSTGEAMTDVFALEISRELLVQLANSSTGMRRALRQAAVDKGVNVPAAVVAAEQDCAEWVGFGLPAGWSESGLIAALTTVWADTLPDRWAVLVLDPAHQGPPNRSGRTVVASADPNEPIAPILAALHVAELDYIFLDTAKCLPAQRTEWRQRVEKKVLVFDGAAKPDEIGFRQDVPQVDVVRVPGAVSPIARNAVRIKMTANDLNLPLAAGVRAGFERLARSISDRTVALALGGGGAWGYAHVALIRALHQRNVPIDMIAGCSFGSMVGSYYCTKGLAGLDTLVERANRFNLLLPTALATSFTIEALACADIGNPQLDDLEIPFFPVATDMANGDAVAITGTDIGFGVRASGSFPGFFTATTGKNPETGREVRYVDGGIRDNVPEDAVLRAGADLVIASNIVPLPAPEKLHAPLFDNKWWRFVAEANPFGRMRDGWRSVFILFHAAGETGNLSADVVFDSPPNQFMATSFGAAKQIVAMADHDVVPAADEAAKRWKTMTSVV